MRLQEAPESRRSGTLFQPLPYRTVLLPPGSFSSQPRTRFLRALTPLASHFLYSSCLASCLCAQPLRHRWSERQLPLPTSCYDLTIPTFCLRLVPLLRCHSYVRSSFFVLPVPLPPLQDSRLSLSQGLLDLLQRWAGDAGATPEERELAKQLHEDFSRWVTAERLSNRKGNQSACRSLTGTGWGRGRRCGHAHLLP